MAKLSVEDLDLQDRRVLVRVDFNVPLKESAGRMTVADDTRIRAALPTIEKISESGGVAVLMSHLGRPKGEKNEKFSLRPVTAALEKLLGKNVRFLAETIGEGALAAVAEAAPGDVILLENTRFLPGETRNDPELARHLARLGDVFVNDAFGSAHRAHASTEGVTHHVDQSAMGFLLKKEVDYLSKVLQAPEKPFTAVIGGAKVSDKIGVIQSLLPKVDALLIGGAMSYTFLRALGSRTGNSLVEEDKLDVARELHENAGGRIELPTDHIAGAEFDNNAERRTVEGDIPDDWMGLDIGSDTVRMYGNTIRDSKMVVWNGPMGVFEMSNFSKGTFAIAEAMADATRKGAVTIVGGGDSVAAIVEAGYEEAVSHVSTGGGAMLEFLEGKTLPGVAALTDK